VKLFFSFTWSGVFPANVNARIIPARHSGVIWDTIENIYHIVKQSRQDA